jgi:ADP-ribose diphosphatase
MRLPFGYISGMAMAKRSGKKPKVQVISSRLLCRGKVFTVSSDEVIEPSGVRARRDIIRHPGSVVILAVDTGQREPRVLLIRQYRYAAGAYLWELPAGHIDQGEDPLTAAKRELQEETGYTARYWKPALKFYASPGFLDETMWVYLARDLQRGQAEPEEDESIRARFFPMSDAVRMATSGKLSDGKTIAGILWFQQQAKQS